jgi:hypothetical protein
MTRKQQRKLGRIRQFIPACPNIYEIEGFTPNGLTGVPDSMRLWPWFKRLDLAWVGDFHDYLYWLGGRCEETRLLADMALR